MRRDTQRYAEKHRGTGGRKVREALDERPGIQIPLTWIGVEELPIHLANQFVCQFEQQEFILTFGQMSPPALLGGTEEERAEQAEQIDFVPVRPLARLAFTETRLRELVAVLEANLRNYEQHQQELRGGEEWPNM